VSLTRQSIEKIDDSLALMTPDFALSKIPFHALLSESGAKHSTDRMGVC
jgi:hypothetical protein